MGVINKVVLDGTTHTIAASALAICDTAAASSAKVATVSGNQAFTLIEGTTIQVKFEYSNTATNPTLNINGTGAKPIYRYGAIAVGNQTTSSWMAGSIISFTYNGTGWIFNGYQTGTGGGGAEQQNADWTETTGVTSILHKPTEFNPTSHASSSSNYGIGNSGQYGHVKLSNAIASESSIPEGFAATPLAVNNAKEYALNHSVPLTRTINDKPLSSNISLNYTDVGAPSLAAVPQISAVTSSGVNIADVTVNGITTHLYAPAGGSSEPQVNSDWNASSGPSSILNKPTIPTDYSDVGAASAQHVHGNISKTGTIPQKSSLDRYDTIVVREASGQIIGGRINFSPSANSGEYLLSSHGEWSQAKASYVVVDDGTSTLSATNIQDALLEVNNNIPNITVEPLVEEGVNIADININEDTIHLFAPQGGGGGGSQLNADWAADAGVTSILHKPNIPVVTASSNVTVGAEIGSITVDSATTTLYSDWMMVEATASWSADELYDFNITNGYTNEDIDNYAETGKIHLKVTRKSWVDIGGQGSWLPIGGALIYTYSNSWLGHVFQAIQETTVKAYTLNGSGENYNWIYEESSLEGTNADWEAISGPSVILNKPDTFNPDYHASEDSEYGLGTENLYGHVALSDSYTSDASAGDGVAATPLAISQVYNAIPQISVTSGQYLANQYFVGSITVDGETTEFYAPNLTALTLSATQRLDEDDLLHISANFTNGLPVRVRQSIINPGEENIDYLDLVDVAGNNGDGVPSYLTFIGTSSTQIHRAYYDDTSSLLIKWTTDYTQIPAIPTSTAAVSSGDRLLVQTIISTASDTSSLPTLISLDTYEIKTTSITFGNSTTQFLANDGQWRTPSGGGGGGSTVSVTAITTEGTNIADITVDNVTTHLYAPSGGGSSTTSMSYYDGALDIQIT